MTVHRLETPLQLPAVDMTTLNTARAQLRHLAEALTDIYLPVKHEALKGLLTELGNTDKAALDSLALVPGLLDNDGLQDLLSALARLKGDPPDEQTLKAIDEISAEIESQVQAARSGLDSRARDLDDALVNLAHVNVGDVDHLIPPIEAELARLDAVIAAQEGPLAKLLEQEGMLNTLIADIEAISLWDKFKTLADSLKALIDIDPRNPLIGSIKAGIEGLGNMLNLASESLKYEHLVRQRERIQAQLDDLQGNARQLRLQRQAESRKLEQLKQLKLIEAPQQSYAQEIGKLLEALKRFQALHPALALEQIEAQASAFIANGRVLSDYLNELRRAWRS